MAGPQWQEIGGSYPSCERILVRQGIDMPPGTIAVVTDGDTMTGDGTTADPLVSVGGAVADNVTITGTGTTADPLVSVGGAVADNVTITGTGTAADPLVAVAAMPIPTTEHLTGSGGDPAVAITPGVSTSFLENDTAESVLDFSLADGTVDGQEHNLVNDAAGDTAVIVITPDNFRDGATLTSTAGAASGTLIWNAVGGEWHVLGTPRNFTVG
jgi:hypothetical protein